MLVWSGDMNVHACGCSCRPTRLRWAYTPSSVLHVFEASDTAALLLVLQSQWVVTSAIIAAELVITAAILPKKIR